MRRGAAALVAVGVLLASACGARWDDEQAAAVLARADGTASGTGSAAAPTGGGTSGPTVGSTAPAAAGGGGAASPGGGGSAGPATGAGGPATPGVATGDQPSGPAPCSAPSDAPGVTADTIEIGVISSLTGPVAGLGSSSSAAVRSYVAYRNATGGVCGRRVVLREADDGTDNARYRSVVTDLGGRVLGIVGGFAFGDVGGADVIAGLGLPVVSLPSAQSVADLPTVIDLNPAFDSLDVAIGKYRFLREQGVQRAVQAYLAVDQSRFEAQLQARLMAAAGIEVAQIIELPLATISYDSTARAVLNSGAQYLFFIGDTTGNASMARSMAGTGQRLPFEEYFTFAYGTPYLELAGPAAEGTITWLRALPDEDAGANAELATYLEWMARIAPGEPTDPFAADSWASAKAFFDALAALPGPITREALVAQLTSVETFDAGGIYGPIRMGAERTNGCVVGMRVVGGAWQRLTPASGFLC